MVKMEVFNISFNSMSRSFLVLLSDETRERVLPISIGPPEAIAIYSHLKGQLPARPITHDLLKLILDSFGADVSKILVSDLRGGTYYARITLEHNGASTEIDSRPSDAIALALRMEAPIYVSEEVLQEAGQDSAEFGIGPDNEPLGPGDIEEEFGAETVDAFLEQASSAQPDTDHDDDISALRAKLKEAVAYEEYEEAAKIRDQITQLTKERGNSS